MQHLVTQGHLALAGGLEMGVVGSRSPTLRPVVKHHIVLQTRRQLQHIVDPTRQPLRHMPQVGDGQVTLEYGIGIDLYLVMAAPQDGLLPRGLMLGAQEALPPAQRRLVDGSGR